MQRSVFVRRLAASLHSAWHLTVDLLRFVADIPRRATAAAAAAAAQTGLVAEERFVPRTSRDIVKYVRGSKSNC